MSWSSIRTDSDTWATNIGNDWIDTGSIGGTGLAGDIVVFVAFKHSSSRTTLSITSGGTLIASNGSNPWFAAYQCTGTGALGYTADSADLELDDAGALIILRIRSTHTGPIALDKFSSLISATGTVISIPTHVVTNANSANIAFGVHLTASPTWSGYGSYTEMIDIQGGSLGLDWSVTPETLTLDGITSSITGALRAQVITIYEKNNRRIFIT